MDAISLAAPPPEPDLIDRGWRPIWRSHTIEVNGKKYPLDRSHLERVAQRSNELIDRYGTFGVAIEGHTDPSQPREVRPVRGYIGPFKVGDFGGQPTLFARERYYRDFEPRLKDYPHKSAEYVYSGSDPTDGYIAAVALLHAGETPRFHLGLNYAAGAVHRLRYAAPPIRDDETSPMNDAPPAAPPATESETAAPPVDPAMLKAVLDAMIPAVKQVVSEMLAAAGVAAAPATPEGSAPAPPPTPSPSAGGEPEGIAKPGDEKKADYADLATARLRYEREVAERRKVEERLAEAETKLAKVDDERRQTARYAAIAQLRADGYVVGEDEAEYAALAKFSDEQLPDVLHQRRLYGQRVPQGSLPVPASEKLAPAETTQQRQSRAAKAAALARAKGISLAQAMAEVA